MENKPKMQEYTLVGRIKATIAKKAHIKAGYIYISNNHVRHIANVHKKELAQIGIDALSFVRVICGNFNQIRKGSGSSFLLVVYDEKLSRVAAIDLNFSLKKQYWEVKTAEPRRKSAVIRSALVWEAAKHTPNGNGNRLD